MSYRLGVFSDVGLDQAKLRLVLDEHERGCVPRLEKWWTYYRNPLQPVGVGRGQSGKWYKQPQEVGLPARLRACGSDGTLRDDRAASRREVVIENDIAWRVQAMVDFMFGKPVAIRSTGPGEKRGIIERVLDTVWERSGGIALLQDMAVMGHVFGHVDLVVRVDEDALAVAQVSGNGSDESILAAAEAVTIEVVEPRRGVPVMNAHDYRALDAYVIRTRVGEQRSTEDSMSLRGMLRAIAGGGKSDAEGEFLEVISASAWQMYQGGELVWEQSRAWTGGAMPVVHIQNISQPLEYEGLSEVEPLIPLQDELNTRLSDRASRVTMQSFKMYLAKGVEGFDQVGPGQVWYTDNMGASVQAFGGDGESPSEEAHIREVREALDKVSGVPTPTPTPTPAPTPTWAAVPAVRSWIFMRGITPAGVRRALEIVLLLIQIYAALRSVQAAIVACA